MREMTEGEVCGYIAGALTYGLLHEATWDQYMKTRPRNGGRQIANLDTHVSWGIVDYATMRVSRDIDTWDE